MFHENLKAQRKRKGYTQETLAIKVHVVRQTVSKWEKGLSVPDADMLQKLAEVLDCSVSQLLGADITEDEDSRNEVAEQLARINEQLAIKNRRARRIWKGVGIVFGMLILIPILSSFLFIARTSSSTHEVAGETQWVCTLDGEEYIYSIQYNEDYQILVSGGDAYIDNHIDTQNYDDANQLAAHLEDYFKERGGSVSVVSQEGLKISTR